MDIRDWQSSVASVDTSQALRAHLGGNEQLLWSGLPRQGLLLRGSDVFMIPFSVFWCGFAIFWTYTARSSGAPADFWMFGLIFVAVGLYIVFGRFFVDALQRQRTTYGLSNERILIVSGLFQRETKSLSLRTLSDITLTEKSNGSGTITFGPMSSMNSWFAGAWPGLPAPQPCFDGIPRARHVYDLIRDAQKRAS